MDNTLIKEMSNNNEFMMSVPVHIMMQTEKDFREKDTLMVKFEMEFSYRTWGINEIRLNITRIEPLTIVFYEGGTVDIHLLPLKLRKEDSNLGYMGVGEITLYVLENGTVDYNNSYIEISKTC